MKTDTGPHYRLSMGVGALAKYLTANKLVGLLHMPQQQPDLIEAEAVKPGANDNARLHAIRWMRELLPGQVVLLCAKLRVKVR